MFRKRLCSLVIRWPAIILLLPQLSFAQGETGNFCVRDYQSGATCTANDVRIEALTPVMVIEDCSSGVIGEAEMIFEALVSADASPDRYDIGLYLALDGDNARDGDSCLHDYLEPPLTATPTLGDANMDGIPDVDGGPWLDNDSDSCGDIGTNTQALKTLQSLRFACLDSNSDGSVDIAVCTSWDNSAGSVCNGLSDAFPGTNAKCSCGSIELGIAPVVVTEAPAIGIAKRLVSVTDAGGGRLDVALSLVVENLGDVALSNVQVTDDLTATFPAPVTFAVQAGPSASGTLTANVAFDGAGDSNLLNGAASTLAIGTFATIDFTVRIAPNGAAGPFLNTAAASGESPIGSPVTDTSDDGADPDPDGDGDANEPRENDPTPIVIPEVVPGNATSSFATTVSFTNGYDGTVGVTLDCNNGLPLQQSKNISQASGVKFIVQSLDIGNPTTACSISVSVDSGYTSSVLANGVDTGSSCLYSASPEAGEAPLDTTPEQANTCAIVAEPTQSRFLVYKEWVTEGDGNTSHSGEIEISCTPAAEDTGSTFGTVSDTVTVNGDGSWYLDFYPSPNGAQCTATESLTSSAVESASECPNGVPFAVGDTLKTCTITNTVYFEGIPALSRPGMLFLVLLTVGLGFVGMRRLA